jgi:predicted TIM-barrel fold metal-dependent hydrolase
MKKSLLLVVLVLSIVGSKAQDLPIIDVHLHMQDEVMPKGPATYPIVIDELPDTKIKDVSELLPLTVKAMRENNVVLGIVTWEDLEKVYEWQKYAPGMFLTGVLFWDPLKPDIELIRKEIQEGRLDIIGEIAVQYNGFAPNDPRLEKFYSLAEEQDVPVLIHCGGLAGPNEYFDIKDGNPLLLEDVLKKHPNLRIFIENAAYPYGQEIVALMYRYPNVYADLSTISWILPRKAFHNYLEHLMDANLGKRLMYGSDQMIWPETIAMAIEAIETASFLSEAQKRDIFYNNAAEFLRLSEEVIEKHHDIAAGK